MSQYPDDVLHGDRPSAEQIEKRSKELKTWIGQFIILFGQKTSADKVLDLDYDEASAEQINADYWELMYERIKPRIKNHSGKEKRADRHKIASLLELLVNWHQPITIDDKKQQDIINAHLAYFVALAVIGNWNQLKGKNLSESITFKREHVALLTAMSKNGGETLPIFSNAATWYAVEKILLARYTKQIP